MANKNNVRNVHSSPGVYFSESVLNYSAKSLGITALGVAGETLKGPAFQPITIESWRDFQNYFGGTSTEKYRGSQYPKYELPYIAKTYLEQSQQLEVVRTLGLSGVNAGPAWLITATKHETGAKYTYSGIAYMPVDEAEYEWIEGVNSFGINDELPCPISENPTENSPAYYRQVVRINREEAECPKNYNWLGRTYTEYEELAKDEHIDGYIRYQDGYTYEEIAIEPTGTEWVDGENAFCEYPNFTPVETSPEYIRVNCNQCAYVITEGPDSEATYTEGVTWFDKIPSDVTCNSAEDIRVSTGEWKNIVVPVVIPAYEEGNTYFNERGGLTCKDDIVYTDHDTSDAKTFDILNGNEIIKYNGVTYSFIKLGESGNTWIWNGNSYEKFYDGIPCPSVGEYVKFDDDFYKRSGNSYVNAHLNTDSASCTNNLFPSLNVFDESMHNTVYSRNEGYTYNLSETVTPDSDFDITNIFYSTESNPTGGAENWYVDPSKYVDANDQYCMIGELEWNETEEVHTEAKDYGFTPVDAIDDSNAEYVKVVSAFHYGCCTECNLDTPIDVEDWKVSIPTAGQTSTYNVSSLTSEERNELAMFVFTDNAEFGSDFAGRVENYGYVPEWIMIAGELFRLGVDEYKYYERGIKSGSEKYYEAQTNCLYKAAIVDDSYYALTEYYKYYRLSADYTCYAVSPVYRYNMLVQGVGQLATEDTECCEDNLNTVVAVLRSRGEHKKAKFVREPNAIDEENGICDDIYEYDGIEYYAKSVRLEPSASLKLGTSCTPGYSAETGDFAIDSTNYGIFTIVVTDNYDTEHRYSVSLNPTDTNYIYKVIGGNPEDGDAEVFVEELYDVALSQMIEEGKVNAINKTLAYYAPVHMIPKFAPVTDILTLDEASLNRRYVGNSYLFSNIDSEGIAVRYSTDQGTNWTEGKGVAGVVYHVISKLNASTGKYEFFYGAYVDDVTIDPVTKNTTINVYSRKANFETEYVTPYNYDTDVDKTTLEFSNCLYVEADNMFYIMTTVNGVEDVYPVTIDLNNYKEAFRFSSTPWIVSEMKGSANNVELTKLFRFHTISDGSNSVDEVKISIENIDPEYGTFDVSVRAFGDTDYSPVVLEKYVKCNLVPGDKNYVALRIGSTDGSYEGKSKYITVEVNETDLTRISTPAGFLGYPIRDYSGVGVFKDTESDTDDVLSSQPKMPWFRYNTNLDTDLRSKKQYFGVSDLVGIDTDVLKYKGVEAYNGIPSGLTPCFHLDARILNGKPNADCIVSVDGIDQKVSVDGVCGYTWTTVGRGNVTEQGIEPRIGDEATMRGTIYEDKNNRKFTVAFYGGWDGWDYYRTSRSNSDDFTYSNYKGAVNKVSGFGSTIDVLTNPEAFGLDGTHHALTSDYYAYLAAIKQFSNPKTIDINVVATPGIDYVNNTLLVDEVIEMVEEERSDAIYVVTTPDKPFGAGDSQSEMYSAEDAVDNLDAADIDTNAACTYYPWEKYYDADNNQYIFLPITRDVVKSIAYTDNIAYPWYASAGFNRGNVSGVAPRKKLKIGEQDTLYDGRINFINSFAKEGDRIWGDKNLQVDENLMNRISKKRLMLRIKKLCQKACIGLIFDPNDASMAKTLNSTLKAVMENIKSNRGISDYRIEIDTSAEARDRLELPATIWFKPNPNLEYIPIDLVATPQGVSF